MKSNNTKTNLNSFISDLNGSGVLPEFLQTLRDNAKDQFLKSGFPTTKMEDWRFTNISEITNINFSPPSKTIMEKDSIKSYLLNGYPKIVLLNGNLVKEYSRTNEQIEINTLSEQIEKEPARLEQHFGKLIKSGNNPFTILNTANLYSGFIIKIPKNQIIDKPIQILNFVTGANHNQIIQPHNLLILEKNSQAAIIEHHIGLGSDDQIYFNNSVLETFIGENAQLDFTTIQQEKQFAYHISSLNFRQSRNSHLNMTSFDFGSKLTRRDTIIELVGEGSSCDLKGLFMGNGTQHIDNQSTIVHQVPDCTSRELYKGILTDQSQGVFNGLIKVDLDAQRSDSDQKNHNLLISDQSKMNSNPQLEIYADDVQCAHGSTTGQIDEDALFYLQTRGISRRDAISLMINGFANEILSKIKPPELREMISLQISNKLKNQD